MFRQGMTRMLCAKPGIEAAGEAADGVPALELVRSTHPDVLILDVEMPRMEIWTKASTGRRSSSRAFEDSGLAREFS